jgi:hypothetical protein
MTSRAIRRWASSKHLSIGCAPLRCLLGGGFTTFILQFAAIEAHSYDD